MIKLKNAGTHDSVFLNAHQVTGIGEFSGATSVFTSDGTDPWEVLESAESVARLVEEELGKVDEKSLRLSIARVVETWLDPEGGRVHSSDINREFLQLAIAIRNGD